MHMVEEIFAFVLTDLWSRFLKPGHTKFCALFADSSGEYQVDSSRTRRWNMLLKRKSLFLTNKDNLTEILLGFLGWGAEAVGMCAV